MTAESTRGPCHDPPVAEVSVVVPSVGRRSGLAAIARQVATDARVELIVVDNTRAGGAIAAVPGARVVHEPRAGAANARNRGVAEASAPVVVFVDDDVAITGDTVAVLAGPVLAGEVAATVGRVRLDPGVGLPRWLTPPLLGYLSNHDRGEQAHDVGPGDHGLSAAMAVDRATFEGVGGFWAALGPRPDLPRTNDDVQLCRAILRSGARIRYLPEATVVHEVPPDRLTRRFVLRRAFEQGRSDWLLERRWEGRSAPVVLGDAARTLAADLWGNARRLGRGPGTVERSAAAVARAAGTVVAAVREPPR